MDEIFFIVRVKDNDKIFVCIEIEEVGLLQSAYDSVEVEIVDTLDGTEEYINMKTYISIFTDYRAIPIASLAGKIAYKMFSNTKRSIGFKNTIISSLNSRRDGYYSVMHLYDNYLKAVRRYVKQVGGYRNENASI